MRSSKIIFMIIFSTFGLLLFFSNLSAQQTAGELFEKALYLEEAQGDLQKAIELYQRILKQYPDNREVAAKAQLHLGLCYEKLGLEEAQKAFQKVIDNYPEQTEAVKMAREKLSILLRAQAALEKGDKEFKIKQVWTGKGVDGSGEISFDGKYLSFVDWETGDLAIREMATGKNRHLTHKGSWDASSFAFAMTSVWSPDGKQLAYDWENDAKGQAEVHIVGLDGSEPRLLHQVDFYKGWVEVADWSPDGKNILAFILNEAKSWQLGLVSIKDSSIQVLKSFDAVDPFPMKAQFSPDGRYIVYDFPQERESRKKDISLISSDGKKEIPLIAHPADDYLFGWSPDGKWVLFNSDRTGTRDAWIIQVLEGKPHGDPHVVKRDIGLIGSLGFGQDGSFYYSTEGATHDIYSARLDQETGNVIEQPKKDPLPYEGSNFSPDWSPDGKNLVYVSRRGPGKRQSILCLYSAESRRVREFNFKDKFVGFAYPRWCPDSRSILLLAEDFQSVGGIYKIDAQTGEATLLIPEKEKKSYGALWSPVMSLDGKLLFYIHENRSDKYYPVVVRDLKTGKEEEILRNPPHDNNILALSPDGQRLALLLREEENLRVLKVMSIKGGEPRELHRFEFKGRNIIDIDWSPDGRYIYFSKRKPDSEGAKWELWRVPAKGGKAENLGLAMPSLVPLSVHPDGERITFASLSGQTMPPEIWVMENFLPKENIKKK